MKAFGVRGNSEVFSETIPTPVGESCLHCGEKIEQGDSGVVLPLITLDQPQPRIAVYHWECHLRRTIGSVKHQRRECGCFTGNFSQDDDEGYPSRRAAARAALHEFQRDA